MLSPDLKQHLSTDRESSHMGVNTAPCLFALQEDYGKQVAHHLDVPLASYEVRDFEDGEHKIRPLENVRGRDTFVISSLYSDSDQSVNDRLIKTLFLAGALRDAGAGRVTAILPYLCYARKDRRTKARDPVSTRYVAAMLEAVGVDQVVTMDVHNLAAYENAFRIPSENLLAAPVLIQNLKSALSHREPMVISPDVGGIKRADPFRQLLERCLERSVDEGFMHKQRSEGVLSGEQLVADVAERDVILVDDLVSSGGTLARAASACHAQGARSVIAVATHGVFSAKTESVLAASPLEALLVTDTIPLPRPGLSMTWPGIKQIETAPLVAAAIQRLHQGGSLVELATDWAL